MIGYNCLRETFYPIFKLMTNQKFFINILRKQIKKVGNKMIISSIDNFDIFLLLHFYSFSEASRLLLYNYCSVPTED